MANDNAAPPRALGAQEAAGDDKNSPHSARDAGPAADKEDWTGVAPLVH
jgi:hypothetical protein